MACIGVGLSGAGNDGGKVDSDEVHCGIGFAEYISSTQERFLMGVCYYLVVLFSCVSFRMACFSALQFFNN